MNDKIEIPVSKKKSIRMIASSIIFVFFGCWMMLNPEDLISSKYNNSDDIIIVGVLSICFCGAATIVISKKAFDSKAGLIIDQRGITDNTTPTSVGLIEWSSITGIKKRQTMSTKFLMIHTNNPQEYIQRAKNSFSRQTLKMNNKIYGSPISITSKTLAISFEDLEELIKREFEKTDYNGIK